MSAAVPTRTILCSIAGCAARFMRYYDLDKHVQKHHRKLEEVEDAIDPRLRGVAGNNEQF